MKAIENKQTRILKDADIFVTYGDLLLALVNNQPVDKSITLKEMRRDLKLIEQLEKTDLPQFEVSEEDLKHIKQLVMQSQWTIKHVDIIDFADYIESID